MAAAGCAPACVEGRIQVTDVTRVFVAKDVELITAHVERRGERTATVHALYAAPSAVTPRLLINADRRALSAMAPAALAVMNAGFFTPQRKPTGLLASGGKVHSRFVSAGGAAGSGVLVLEDGVVRLLERDAVQPGRSFAQATLAIQAGPRIIENGNKPGIRSDDGARANRTVIGADGSGRLVLAVVLGTGNWTSGPTLFELQQILGAPGLGAGGHAELGLAFALNLDGGPSTGLHVRHAVHRFDAPEASPVYSVLCLEAAR